MVFRYAKNNSIVGQNQTTKDKIFDQTQNQTRSATQKTLSFYESRYGATIGTLNIYVVDTAGNIQGPAIYNASGDLGVTTWYLRETTYSPTGSHRLAFHYISGTSFTGDLALDLITIGGTQYSFEGPSAESWLTSSTNTSSSVTALSGAVSPQYTSTTYTSRWNIYTGQTTSSVTGPLGAYSGTYYIYAETSSPNFSNINMWLFSPVITV